MRDDLLALTPDTLASLANRGLVKRAQKAIEKGKGPELSEDDDGVVTGVFPDGVTTRLVPGTELKDCPCTCGAITVCRHRIAVALAYNDFAGSEAEAAVKGEVWSPAEFTDEQLLEALGKHSFGRARRAILHGLVVEVHRGEDVPTARLPTCTVRFLVPHDLAYAQCDCDQGTGCIHVAIASWAYRAADEEHPDEATAVVELRRDSDDGVPTEALEVCDAFAGDMLWEGVINGGPSLGQRFAQVRTVLDQHRLTWPATIVDEVEELIEAYRTRSARYRPDRAAELLAEIVARGRAVRAGGQLPSSLVLGTGEARETRLDHLRLVSLGVRLSADGDKARHASVFLVDPDTATVMVLGKRWAFREDETAPDGADLGFRTIAPSIRLEALATGQLVTQVARRTANRRVILGRGRGIQTSLTPQRGDWETLPTPVRVDDLAALETLWESRPPAVLRPRVLAESVHVVAVGAVLEVFYAPGDQALVAELQDTAGNPITLVRRFKGVAPRAIPAIADALANEQLRFISGELVRTAAGWQLDPLALVTDKVIVPDLALPPDIEVQLGRELPPPTTIGRAIAGALSCLADGPHRGLETSSSAWATRLHRQAGELKKAGLDQTSSIVERLAKEASGVAQGGRDGAPGAARAWFDAQIHLQLLREALH